MNKTKKQNQDLNLIKKSKIEEELKNIKETVDIIPSYQEKEKYLLRKINEYKRKINWIIRDENFYELQYPNKFKLIYVSKSKLNFIDYLDKINQPQIKDYLSIIFHILNFINNIPTKPPSGILAGNIYSVIDLHHTITAAIYLGINKIPLIMIGK